MSKYLCACSKSHVYDNPSNAPIDVETYTKLRNNDEDAGNVTTDENKEENINTENMFSFEPVATQYELRTTIGRGCNDSATINLARHIPSGTHVAIKRIDLELCTYDLSILQNEIRMCKQLQHEKVLPYYCSFIHSDQLWTVMPLMAFGSCRDLIHAYFQSGLSEQAIAYILRDTLLALEYLHSRGIIHRGVRASHLLLSANGNLCVSGLRNSYCMIHGGKRKKIVFEYPLHAVGSLQWLSPEILEQNLSGYDVKSDIYSVGITACELANGFAPFADMPATQMLLEKLNGTKPVLIDSTTMADLNSSETNKDEGGNTVTMMNAINRKDLSQRTFSQYFHNFIDVCLEKEPASRPSITQLLGHPFFRNLRKRTEEALPKLLHPVSPLSDANTLPPDDNNALEEAANQMENMDLGCEWNF